MTTVKRDSEDIEGTRVWEEDVVKPTYRILKEDPLPYFSSRHYPYTKLNMFDSKPTPVEYKRIVMENEYIQLAVRPELGARLFSAFDKISNRHIFNYIDTIRPALIASRGAWIAVGIEFNLCQHPSHTTDNFSPVDYSYRNNKDGSATMLLGNLNLTTNVRYLVNITLRPETSRIETEIRTFNTDLIPQRYYFWSNAGIPTSEGLRCFYPGYSSNHGKYPLNDEGLDLSWYKNYIRSASVFMLDSEEDFFAAYNYDSSNGVVHHAAHNIVPGKKFFTWGTSDDGLFWNDVLSDRGVPYIEIQSGRFLTQGIVEFIEPLTFESWKEYWYPIRDIGGVTYANDKASLYTDTAESDERRLRFGICSATTCAKARLELYKDGKRFYNEPIRLSPKETILKDLEVPSGKILLRIVDSKGDEIISWDFRRYRTRLPDVPSWRGEAPEWGWSDSAEELWLKGIEAEKRGARSTAKRYFEESLEKDKSFSRSLYSLGLLHYRSGLYDKAAEAFQRALKRDPYDEDARYCLGLTMLALNRCEDAGRELWEVLSGRKNRTLAFYLLGIVKMRMGAYREAEEMFRRSIQENEFNVKSLSMLSLALRKQGKNGQAFEVTEKAYDMMPLDYSVLAERYFLSSDKEFERVVFTDSQKALEVSRDYILAGSFEDASGALKAALDRGFRNPMIYYYIGYILNRMGDVDAATEYYREGGTQKTDYVFAHRLEEIAILEDVINTVPSSPTPHYLLGNILFYKGRLEEGLEKWERAYELGLRNAVLCRNIGYARAMLAKEMDESVDMYLNAINLDPQNSKLYIELDDIYCRAGRFNERLKLLENVPEEAKRGPLLARHASAYIDVGEYNKAIDMLLSTFFEPMEGYYGYWEIYVDALLAKGLTLLKSKKLEDAIECFMDATKYPKNLGIGAPHPKHRKDVMQLYYAGLAYQKMRNIAAAEEIWHQALQRTPQLSNEHNTFKALVFRKLGREEESRSLIREIMAATSADAHYTIGLAYIAEGRRDEGLKKIDEALEVTKADRHARWVKDGTLII